MVWKCLHGEAPSYLVNLYVPVALIEVVNGCTLLHPAIWWSHKLRLFSVSWPSLCSGLWCETHYLHLCDRWMQHKIVLARTCSSSNCSGTLATSNSDVAATVSAAPHIKLMNYLLTDLLWINDTAAVADNLLTTQAILATSCILHYQKQLKPIPSYSLGGITYKQTQKVHFQVE